MDESNAASECIGMLGSMDHEELTFLEDGIIGTAEDAEQLMALSDTWAKRDGEWMCVESIMDSGAVNHAAPPEVAPHVEIKPSAGSVAGKMYSMADGNTKPNLGEKPMDFIATDGKGAHQVYQMAQISKPLTSVGEICDKRNRVVFGSSGGFIYNLDTHRVIPFHRKNKLYAMNQWVRLKKNPTDEPFHRPGK